MQHPTPIDDAAERRADTVAAPRPRKVLPIAALLVTATAIGGGAYVSADAMEGASAPRRATVTMARVQPGSDVAVRCDFTDVDPSELGLPPLPPGAPAPDAAGATAGAAGFGVSVRGKVLHGSTPQAADTADGPVTATAPGPGLAPRRIIVFRNDGGSQAGVARTVGAPPEPLTAPLLPPLGGDGIAPPSDDAPGGPLPAPPDAPAFTERAGSAEECAAMRAESFPPGGRATAGAIAVAAEPVPTTAP